MNILCEWGNLPTNSLSEYGDLSWLSVALRAPLLTFSFCLLFWNIWNRKLYKIWCISRRELKPQSDAHVWHTHYLYSDWTDLLLMILEHCSFQLRSICLDVTLLNHFNIKLELIQPHVSNSHIKMRPPLISSMSILNTIGLNTDHYGNLPTFI